MNIINNKDIPLAERVRPKILDEFIGHKKLIGKDGVIRKLLESSILPSLIFWGPPGSGKTTLAGIIANQTERKVFNLSAINSGVAEVRKVIEEAEKMQSSLFGKQKPILFIDEIHRFNKSQQDSLLGVVERGLVTLIGATTENPSFEVNKALLSRSQVVVLESLTPEDIREVLENAIQNDKILKLKNIDIKEIEAIYNISGGDARKSLNILEILVSNSKKELVITNELVIKTIEKTTYFFDKKGEEHYDLASAFIKSIRGSDPQATIYWLSRLIAGGEAPEFIARRMIISASEDIGLANSAALMLANTTFESVQKIGMPEARIILSHCAVYLATSPKSNSVYLAIGKGLEFVKNNPHYPVPLWLRNAPTKLMKDLDYGKNYHYAHDFEGNFVEQEFLPEEISGTTFFTTSNNKKEEEIRKDQSQKWGGKYEV